MKLPWLIWALTWCSIIAAAVWLAGCAVPKVESFILAGRDGDYIRIHSSPCEQSSGWLKMQKADMRFKGKDYAACWFAVGSTVVVIDEAGDTSAVPVSYFKKEEAV